MDRDSLFKTFRLAISQEHEAYEFYQKAAAGTDSAAAKELFKKFAARELSHKTELEKMYNELVNYIDDFSKRAP
jgi:rubrerythrin